MKEIFLNAGALTASVTGAGLITGCEISLWFTTGSAADIIYIAVSAFLLGAFFYILMCYCDMNNINSIDELFSVYSGRTAVFARLSIYVLMLFVYSAMISSCAELLCLFIHINRLVACVLCGAVMTVFSVCGTRRILAFNGIAGIFILCAVLLFCAYMILFSDTYAFSDHITRAARSARYSGYNVLSCVPVITAIHALSPSSRRYPYICVISAFMIFTVMALIYTVSASYAVPVAGGDMPMLFAARNAGENMYIIYSLAALAAVITTALSCGMGLTGLLRPYTGNLGAVILISAVSIPLSFIGLGVIVKYLYGICGILGIIFMFITVKNVKNKSKTAKSKEIPK